MIQDDEKIIQIIPAPDNLYAIYTDDMGDFESKIICYGLLNTGEVIMIDCDDYGETGEIIGAKKIVWKEKS